MFLILIIGWALTTVSLIVNFLLGINLAQSIEASSSLHLLLALTALFLGVGSHFLLMKESQRSIEFIVQKLTTKIDLRESIRLGQKKAMAAGLISLAFIAVSLITGTISHAGKFPLIHAILGIIVVGVSLQALHLWIRLHLKIQNI